VGTDTDRVTFGKQDEDVLLISEVVSTSSARKDYDDCTAKYGRYAIPLSDKTCKHGRTKRTALFIHSEMTRTGGHGRPESQRWDGPGDYKSHGCIKLAPDDIKKLFAVLADGPAPHRLTVV
jgi:hypothetical protein